MKHIKYLAVLLILIPTPIAFAATDYFLKIEGVEGEVVGDAVNVSDSEPAKTMPADDWIMPPSAGIRPIEVEQDSAMDVVTTQSDSTVKPPVPPQEGSGDVFLEIGGVDGESAKKSNSVTAPVLDVATSPEPISPDFSILLGGDSETEAILLRGVKDEGLAVERVSLENEKIETTVRSSGKLFGLFAVSLPATVEIDGEERIKVRFPWWGFLVSGKESSTVGEKVFAAISNVLKTKHDTVKNSVGNIR